MAQPGQRHVAGHGEREGADRTHFLAPLRGAGREEMRVGFLQKLVDVGGVARVPVQACAQDPLEFERSDQVAIVTPFHRARWYMALRGWRTRLMTDGESFFHNAAP